MVICFCKSSHHRLRNEPSSGVQKENFSRELLTALNFSWHFSQFFSAGYSIFLVTNVLVCHNQRLQQLVLGFESRDLFFVV